MTTAAQSLYFLKGHQDRTAGRPMVESWTLAPYVANAYRNGYVAACNGEDPGEFEFYGPWVPMIASDAECRAVEARFGA